MGILYAGVLVNWLVLRLFIKLNVMPKSMQKEKFWTEDSC